MLRLRCSYLWYWCGTAQSLDIRGYSPEASDAAMSAAHAPYARLCAAEAAEA